MTESLGAKLARNLAQEQSLASAAAQREKAHTNSEALRKMVTVSRFFENARAFFETSILAGVASSQLHLVLGTTGTQASQHPDVYEALELWGVGTQPKIVQPSNPLHALWADFVGWAHGVGLEPVWTYCWDGSGVHSWYQLSVEPRVNASASSGFVNPNDVTIQHSYCLHVLHSTLHGYADAVRVLQALQGHPMAQAHLRKYARLIATSAELQAKLG